MRSISATVSFSAGVAVAWLEHMTTNRILMPVGGKTSKIGIVHNVMEYETLQPEAFSARWVDPVVVWLNRV